MDSDLDGLGWEENQESPDSPSIFWVKTMVSVPVIISVLLILVLYESRKGGLNWQLDLIGEIYQAGKVGGPDPCI